MLPRRSRGALIPLGRGGTWRDARRACALRERKTEEEGRTGSLTRLEPDVSPMLRDEFATQIEAQAGPADPLGLAIGRPDKPTKQSGLLCLRDADALIPNTDERLLPLWD